MLVSDRDEIIRLLSRKEGREEGREEGELKKARKVALKMLAKGQTIDTIVEFTELSEQEVLALRDGLPLKAAM
ncbi:MAG: hypothetical protein LBR11_00765 [Deltaproteobacteria bacterium]|nr:hypothetical protein [Deltaproteobacteria bacterium]